MVTTRTAAGGKPGGRHRNALHRTLVAADRGNHEPLVVVDAEGCHALGAERGFHALQVDAQAVQLDEAAAAADHLVEPVGCAARDVTRVQGVDRLAQRQIRWAVRVAHHDVRPVVHQLADVGIGPSVERLDGEGATGDGSADRCGCDCASSGGR